jgi:hypothetical protein
LIVKGLVAQSHPHREVLLEVRDRREMFAEQHGIVARRFRVEEAVSVPIGFGVAVAGNVVPYQRKSRKRPFYHPRSFL